MFKSPPFSECSKGFSWNLNLLALSNPSSGGSRPHTVHHGLGPPLPPSPTVPCHPPYLSNLRTQAQPCENVHLLCSPFRRTRTIHRSGWFPSAVWTRREGGRSPHRVRQLDFCSLLSCLWSSEEVSSQADSVIVRSKRPVSNDSSSSVI